MSSEDAKAIHLELQSKVINSKDRFIAYFTNKEKLKGKNMLFEKERHLPLESKEWSETLVKDSVREIVEGAIESINKNDNPKQSLYFGTAGTLWGLIQTADFLEIKLPLRLKEVTESIYQSYLKDPDTESIVPSYFLGESGVLLLKLKYNFNEKDADRLYEIIKSNIQNPTLETLWGTPGSMLAAFHIYQIEKNVRWESLIRESADFLINSLKEFNEKGQKIWEQDLYGRKIHYVGAGHGYFGNVYPLLKCLKFLKQEDQKFILQNVAETTKSLAIEEDGLVNWPATLTQGKSKNPLVQWCHGAPGILNSLIDFPAGIDEEFESLLVKAGELIWKAGPLTKGVGLCHGTDGNGISFLQLYKRTGDELWLNRARHFAMDVLEHPKGNYSLFTGDIGLAVFLMNCIIKDDGFPVLDIF